MLAAPRKNAVQNLVGGPGRSSAATTSHSTSSAGAMAAVPMTVGREARRFIKEKRSRLENSGNHIWGGSAGFSCHYGAKFFPFANKCGERVGAMADVGCRRLLRLYRLFLLAGMGNEGGGDPPPNRPSDEGRLPRRIAII